MTPQKIQTTTRTTTQKTQKANAGVRPTQATEGTTVSEPTEPSDFTKFGSHFISNSGSNIPAYYSTESLYYSIINNPMATEKRVDMVLTDHIIKIKELRIRLKKLKDLLSVPIKNSIN